MKSRTNANISVIPKEVVTVTVSASAGAISGYEIQIVDSESNVMYTQNTSNATYDIPYGTSYTIKASQVDGYITPPAQTYIASQPTRNVDVVYGEEKIGVLIYDIYGNLTNPDNWDTNNNGKAVGVAVITENCSFVIAKEDALSSNAYWGGNETDIATLTNYSNASDAAVDFDGIGNTDKIIASIGNTHDGYRTGSAAEDCRTYVFPNGVKGYLGSAGEWQAVCENEGVVDSTLAIIDGVLMGDRYWTSSESDSERAFHLWLGSGAKGLAIDYKYYSFRVRAFTPVISPDDIITFYINLTKYSCVKGTTWGQWCKSAFNTDGWYVDSDGRTIRWDRMIDMGIIEYVDGVYATDVILSGGNYLRNEKEM